MEKFVDVILPLPLHRYFTYSLPEEMAGDVQIGCRVVVPFGKKKYYTGIVQNVHYLKPEEYEVKEVTALLDAHPILLPGQFKFWEWVADYYLCTQGDVYKAALPSGLKLESETIVEYNPDFEATEPLPEREQRVLDLLSVEPEQCVTKLEKDTGFKNILNVVKSLLDKEAIFVKEELRRTYKPKTETRVRLTAAASNERRLHFFFDELQRRAPKQLDLLMKYIELRTQPFQQCTEAPQPGIMVTNPPYGERISSRDLLGLYNMIGERVKHVFTGYKVWILSYKDECFDKIGLKPSEKMKLMNGSLECEYRCYDIFEGKIKDYKKALNEEGEARPSRPERPSFERKPDRSSRPNFRTDRMDRPARRFAAAHAEDDNERTPFIPGKRYFGDDRADGRSARRDFVGKRPVKRHFKDDEEFGGKKKFGDHSFKKPFKRRGKDDFED